MLVTLDSLSLPTVFFVSLAVSALSALLLLHPRIPLSFVRIHVGIITLPVLVALMAIVTTDANTIIGPWRLDPLAWLMALFVLTIGLVVQRYSIRYLLGDRFYRKYFALLTLTTGAASVAWLSDDLRWLLVCWGATLLGLTLLLRLNREWQAARILAARSGRVFALSWLILLVAIIWLTQVTGHWQLSYVLTKDGLAQFGSWERTAINLLLVVAMVIPAAQWPFQRWLLESVVAPTPVSAVMHAGLVNAGGIMLTRFAPLFSGDVAQIVLLVLASISVLLGTGIILVQVDYKRQLVASTIAQMGFMLIQIALGAYLAAIIHLVLHGLFKASLFLQAGSAVRRDGLTSRTTQSSSFLWIIAGGALGLLVGIGFWLTAPEEGYQLISALIYGWSVSFAWTQLVASGDGRIGRLTGFSLLASMAIVFSIIQEAFDGLLDEAVQQGIQPPTPVVILALFILLFGSALGGWLTRNRSSASSAVIYLWLVRLGEPHRDSVESHPKYLSQYMSRGGHQQ
ncbi:NADH dehydrogenase subunit 5 [Aquibacillus sp. 3ASR75-11]|uniref:Probable inorganic carbon transporter subunit DabB n=1 Tax=Terrihalobacillus insolitus TaxID=2950438 RepID=A0A9X3WQ27_9BACI|nr:NADH dehydrogenase subunit 5 [Terrihalobacillus insolitus]MDC3412186.1 NADH dehydrogenase subunit 5 [Terrihalobacillus insolitus]MDC3423120.1 NADH dehydrogenase subunit 5 [Terrihalobacillus insolitus]